VALVDQIDDIQECKHKDIAGSNDQRIVGDWLFDLGDLRIGIISPDADSPAQWIQAFFLRSPEDAVALSLRDRMVDAGPRGRKRSDLQRAPLGYDSNPIFILVRFCFQIERDDIEAISPQFHPQMINLLSHQNKR